MCEHENIIKRAEETASRMPGEGDQHAATAIQSCWRRWPKKPKLQTTGADLPCNLTTTECKHLGTLKQS